MSALPTRAYAARINPIISDTSGRETLENIAQIVADLGYCISTLASVPDAKLPTVYQLTNVLAAAISYEAAAIQEEKRHV
jgi:hypothetical protein